MAYYSLQAAYTPLGWAALLKDPQHRLEAITPVIERLGGTVANGWVMFGDYDLLVVCELVTGQRQRRGPVHGDLGRRRGQGRQDHAAHELRGRAPSHGQGEGRRVCAAAQRDPLLRCLSRRRLRSR